MEAAILRRVTSRAARRLLLHEYNRTALTRRNNSWLITYKNQVDRSRSRRTRRHHQAESKQCGEGERTFSIKRSVLIVASFQRFNPPYRLAYITLITSGFYKALNLNAMKQHALSKGVLLYHIHIDEV